MAKPILTVIAATVAIGNIQVEGLYASDNNYYVASIQAGELFGLLKKNLSRDIKALLPPGFEFFQAKLLDRSTIISNKSEVRDAGHKGLINIIDLDSFRSLIRALDKKNNPVADLLSDALIGLSIKELFSDAFGKEVSKEDRQKELCRIMDIARTYEALYDPDICKKGFSWFGCQFYWEYFYFWMTNEERAKHERLNPVVNGRRKKRIHQWLDEPTRDRLHRKAIELNVLMLQSNTREAFLHNFAATYGKGWQLNLL